MKKPVFKLLADHLQNYGHCQLTYSTRNRHGERIYYCLQDDFELRLMRCTQELEPSHEAKIKEPCEFEIPKITKHDSNYTIELKKKCINWIKENGGLK